MRSICAPLTEIQARSERAGTEERNTNNMSNAWAAQLDEEGHVDFETRPCIVCNEEGHLALPTAGFRAWRSGAFVQDAFPTMPADKREQLITGTHPACWERLFGSEDD